MFSSSNYIVVDLWYKPYRFISPSLLNFKCNLTVFALNFDQPTFGEVGKQFLTFFESQVTMSLQCSNQLFELANSDMCGNNVVVFLANNFETSQFSLYTPSECKLSTEPCSVENTLTTLVYFQLNTFVFSSVTTQLE